jgi:Spherulation-specific family 4
VQYGRKTAQTALDEISQYAAWSDHNNGLALQGIFVDESPQIADDHNSTFLDQVAQHIKNQKALSGGLLGKLFLSALSYPCSPSARFRPILGQITPETTQFMMRIGTECESQS